MIPNHASLTLALLVCGEVAAAQQGAKIHKMIDEKGVVVDTVLGTALINMYAKSGSIDKATKVSHLCSPSNYKFC